MQQAESKSRQVQPNHTKTFSWQSQTHSFMCPDCVSNVSGCNLTKTLLMSINRQWDNTDASLMFMH